MTQHEHDELIQQKTALGEEIKLLRAEIDSYQAQMDRITYRLIHDLVEEESP